eukprot:UN26618
MDVHIQSVLQTLLYQLIVQYIIYLKTRDISKAFVWTSVLTNVFLAFYGFNEFMEIYIYSGNKVWDLTPVDRMYINGTSLALMLAHTIVGYELFGWIMETYLNGMRLPIVLHHVSAIYCIGTSLYIPFGQYSSSFCGVCMFNNIFLKLR